MAITTTLGAENVDTSSPFDSASWTPAADDLIIAFGSSRRSNGGSSTITAMTDDDSNTYTTIHTEGPHYWQGGSNFTAYMQTARTTVDASPTATITDLNHTGQVNGLFHIVRVAGADTTTPIAQEDSVGGDPNGGTIGNINLGTPSAGDRILIGIFAANSSAPSIGTPTFDGNNMTQVGTQVGAAFNWQECWEYDCDGTETGGVVSVPSWGGSRNAIIGGVRITEASSGTTVDGNLLTATPTMYNPTVTVGGVTSVAELLSSAPSLFNPTVSTSGGPQSIDGNLLTNTPTLYNPTVSAGEVTAVANLLTNEITLYQPSATVGSVTPLAEFIASTLSMHEPTVSTITGLEADLLTSAPTMFLPSAVPGGVLVEMVQIVNPTQVHNPTVFDPAEGAPDEDFTTYNKSRLYIVNRTLPLYGAKTGGWME